MHTVATNCSSLTKMVQAYQGLSWMCPDMTSQMTSNDLPPRQMTEGQTVT